ncbi:MAG: DegT/DnrJ/EryC1/StrS family aminotransferase, partial [Candidatus Hodarchaeota archaeon]
MNVPFVDLKAQYEKIGEEIRNAIEDVILDSAFIGGKYLKSFEENFADYIGIKHCVGVGNGTDALFIALKALGIKAGDEVVTAANSFIATSEAITMTGAQVVFIDCDKDTYNIDINKIEESISTKTRAIIPVHLYGQPVDMDGIMDFAEKHELYVIEDAAQAHGAEYKNRKVGTFGHVGCFSFYPGKNLGAYGDGGAVVTDDDSLAKKMRMMANHGRIGKYNHEFEGVNSRLDGLQAAILDVKLRHLEKWNKRRQEVAWRYSEALHDLIYTPKERPDVRHVYHLYVIRVRNRDNMRAILSERGVATGIHYPVPLPFLKAYQYLGHR